MEPPTGTVHHSQSHAQSQRLTQPSFWKQEFLRTHIFLYANPFYLPSGIFSIGKSFVFASRNIFICKSLVKHSYRQTRVQGSVYMLFYAFWALILPLRTFRRKFKYSQRNNTVRGNCHKHVPRQYQHPDHCIHLHVFPPQSPTHSNAAEQAQLYCEL